MRPRKSRIFMNFIYRLKENIMDTLLEIMGIENFWSNIEDKRIDYKFEKKHYILECDRCGQLLAPFVRHIGPRECGWTLITTKHYKAWICHQCYDHGIDVNNDKFWSKEIKRRNAETIRLVKRYHYNHPWIKIRKYS